LHLGIISSWRQRIDTLDYLNESAADQLRFVQMIVMGKNRQLLENRNGLPCRPMSFPSGGDEMDWSPGPWLSSWEGNLPPVSQPRYFNNENDGQQMWLLTGSYSLQDG